MTVVGIANAESIEGEIKLEILLTPLYPISYVCQKSVNCSCHCIPDEHSELNVSDDEKEEERLGEDDDDEEDDEEDDEDDEIVVREEDLLAAVPIEMCTCKEDEFTNESNNNLGGKL